MKKSLPLLVFVLVCVWLAFHSLKENGGVEDSHLPVPPETSNSEVEHSGKVRSTLTREKIAEPSVENAPSLLNPVDWWDDGEFVKSLTDQFSLEFDDYRRSFFLECEGGAYGDKNLEISQAAWRMFHPFMRPSLEMFENATQAEKWAFTGVTQRAGIMVQEYGGLIPENLSVVEEVEFRRKMRDEALYTSPEFLLNDKFGSDWDQYPELVAKIRQRWVEQVQHAIPIQSELDVRQRCAMNIYSPVLRSEAHYIWPEIQGYELQMEILSRELYDEMLDVIVDFQQEQQ